MNVNIEKFQEDREKQKSPFFELARKAFLDAGAEEYLSLQEMYRRCPSDLIVRREKPEQILSVIQNEKSFELRPDNKLAKYANAVLWSPSDGPRGLENAFLEGISHKDGVVTVFGFEPQEDATIDYVPDATGGVLNVDRSLVRSVSATVTPESVRFIVLRIPIQQYSEKEMTDLELERLDRYERSISAKPNPQYICRGYFFPGKEEKEMAA